MDTSPQLSPEQLIGKLEMILAAAARHIRQIPDDRLDQKLMDRDRTYRELTYHIFRIAEALLDVAGGELLTYSYYTDNPPDEIQTVAQIGEYGDGVRARVTEWWAGLEDKSCRQTANTYFGEKPLHEVLERSTWHCAQHVRQICMALEEFMGITPDQPLTMTDFEGLPIPEKVWDD